MLSINDFDYFLPKDLIAQTPVSPRDCSRLLVYDTKTDKVFLDRFYNLDKYLPKQSFLVLNDTKVVPARVTLYKENGGKIEVLFLVNEIYQCQNSPLRLDVHRDFAGQVNIRGYVDRKVNVGDKLYFDPFHCIVTIKQEGSIFTFRLDFSLKKLFALLEKKGTMPIPLYIKNTPLNEKQLRRSYQTIFAQGFVPTFPQPKRFGGGSAAAPTASLHFTNRVFKKLERKGIKKYFITLHVGLGTFAPINEDNIRTKKLHAEYYEIDNKVSRFIDKSRLEGKKLVAVGTTVVRTLEAFANSNVKTPNFAKRLRWARQMSKPNSTELFIFFPYHFNMVDSLITNFHLPKSSLMMLVEAFLQFKKSKRNLINLYQTAIKHSFRFYSFGDVMLII